MLSHLHGDHCDRVARRELGRDVPIMTADSALRVTAVPARHTAGPLNLVQPEVMGTVLEYWRTGDARPLRIYVSGDTVLHGDLGRIAERYPEIDLALLHLGGTRVLGVLLSMDHEQGVDLVELLRPDRVVPIHHDDYGMFRSPVSNFLAEARDRRTAAEVRLLNRGDPLPLAQVR